MTLKSQETEPLDRERVLEILREQKPILKERFGITDVSLYGSFARDEGTEKSDVDVLVEFDSVPDWLRYFGAEAYFKEVFGRDVDMARRQDIRSEFRSSILSYAIDV